MSDHHPKKFHRRSIRLPDYDYSQSSAYFITLCTYQKQCTFGYIRDNAVNLSTFGRTVDEEWQKSEKIRTEIHLDDYVVMPNHFHAIVWIAEPETVSNVTVKSYSEKPLLKGKSLGSLIVGFKSAVTSRIRQITPAKPIAVWQRNYT